MYLLQEMELRVEDIDPIKGGQLSEEQKIVYNKAKAEFLEKLGESKQGPDLVKDVFHLMDELTEEYLEQNEITCHCGCSYCCKQLVCCSTLEMQLIVEYIKSRPKPTRRAIKQRAKKEALAFNRFYQNNKADILMSSGSIFAMAGIERWEDGGLALRKAYHGRDCPFLNKSLCSIYPVRPVDCRSAKTKDNVCGKRSPKEIKAKPIRLFFDQIASDIIMKEEERIYGQLQIVPLIGWPISEKFGNFFLGRKPRKGV